MLKKINRDMVMALTPMLMLLAACGGEAAQEKASVSSETENAQEAPVAQQNNHIDYVEFAATDLAAIKTFYGSAFDWEFQDWGPDYVSFSGSGVQGGFNSVETPVVGSTLVILYADDLEASEKRIVDAGGEIVERHDFPGGRRFHFRDPSGNVLGVWTAVADEQD